jgi:hypothetical protein
MFHKKWAFIPSYTGFDTTWSSWYLNPQLIINQFNDIKNNGPGLFRDDKLVYRDSRRNWNLQLQHVGAMDNRFDTNVKVSKFIFNIKDGLKITNNT